MKKNKTLLINNINSIKFLAEIKCEETEAGEMKYYCYTPFGVIGIIPFDDKNREAINENDIWLVGIKKVKNTVIFLRTIKLIGKQI